MGDKCIWSNNEIFDGNLGTKTENIEKLSTESGHLEWYSTNTYSYVIKCKWAAAQVIVLVGDPLVG